MDRPMLLAMLLVIFGLAGVASQNCPEPGVCFKKECIYTDLEPSGSSPTLTVSTTAEMMESLDNNTDPCEDFYQFACGGWIKNHVLDPDSRQDGPTVNNVALTTVRNFLSEKPKPTDLDAVKKAKALYASCIAYDPNTDTTIVSIIKDMFQGWPLACNDCGLKSFNLETYLSKAVQLGVYPLFTLEAAHEYYRYHKDPHRQHSEKRMLHIASPVLGLPFNQYPSVNRIPEYKQIYANNVYSVAKKFGSKYLEKAKQDAKEMENVEKIIGQLYYRAHGKRSPEVVTLNSLDSQHGELLNWTRFVSTLGSHNGVTDINSDERITVSEPELLTTVKTYFLVLPKSIQASYIIWRVIDSMQSVLIKKDKILRGIVGRDVSDTNESLPDEACTIYVSKAFHLVVHRLLYDAHLSPRKLEAVEMMSTSITSAFDELVRKNNWLDNKTLRSIKEKSHLIPTMLMSHKRAMNDSFLNDYYSKVTIDERNFLNNVVNVRKDEFRRNFRTIRKYEPIDRSELPHELVLNYSVIFNRIEFTSVALRPPYFTDSVPMSLNYAGLGFLFGHEIIHGFDKRGRMYNAQLEFGDWWTKRSIQRFDDRSQCLVNQYSEFVYNVTGTHVNGTLSLEENIADNAGLKLAFKVSRREAVHGRKRKRLPRVPFSDEQLFFLKFAQVMCTIENKASAEQRMKGPYSPNEFRVTGTLQNSKEFARVFNCSAGSRMNPGNKCSVW